jgi:hypothetical protein
MERMEKEFKRVKDSKGIMGYWVKSNRRDGALYRNDDVLHLKFVGKVAKRKLIEEIVHSVGDLKKLSDAKVAEIVAK